jgi:hypothetical protein
MDLTNNQNGAPRPSEQQLTYARVLSVGVVLAFGLLVVGSLLYFSGALQPAIPVDALPRLWTLATRDFLRESGMHGGWSWVAMLDRGDILPLGGIAVLAGVSVPCLFALVPGYVRRKDWTYLALTLAMIGTLILAGSGVFATS